jgi:uncharacterized protein YndB with AHSA1/START domain
MTVTSVEKDPAALTMQITAEFEAPVERIWEVWADPRQLERWWGPPTYPATVEEHDLTPGGRVTYFMTGPEGDRHRGWWRVVAVEPPRSLEFVDGFADEDGVPNEEMPQTTTRVQLSSPSAGRTSMVAVTQFPSLEAMEQLVAMGMDEGMTLALGQIEGILEGSSTPV